MLSKAKLKVALKDQDFETVKQIIPSAKKFKTMARDKNFHRLIAPTIKLLFSDKDYYKKAFIVNVMTTMSIFTHDVMKDFKYLTQEERDIISESLMRPLLQDESMFLYAVNHYFELKYFAVTFAKYKNDLAEMVVSSSTLFWRVIQSFSNLQLFCEEHPDHARQAIILVLLDPAKMKDLLVDAINEAIFAGYCLIYCLTGTKIYKDVTTTIIDSAKKAVTQTSHFTFFSTKADDSTLTKTAVFFATVK